MSTAIAIAQPEKAPAKDPLLHSSTFGADGFLRRIYPRVSKDTVKATRKRLGKMLKRIDKDVAALIKTRHDLTGKQVSGHHLLQILHSSAEYSELLTELGYVCTTGATRASLAQYAKCKSGSRAK